ncbi:CAMK/CAMKL/AMPK protein kinase, partial [Sphaeroforma arctica JP610]
DLRQVESEARGFEITDEGINVCQIKHYQVMHNIGKGAFGVVKQGRHETTNRKVALKIVLTKSGVSHKVEDEGNLMIGLHHPHVIRLYEVIKRPDYICMAVELCSEGSLLTLIVSETKLRENLARRLVYETALGLEYLHSQWVIHRDIKPENILLNSNMQVKITDFGCAMKLKHKNEKLEQIIGTLDYAAPEIIDSSYRGQPVDVWSLGVTYYYMLFGALPFKNEGEDIFEFLDRIRDSDLELPEKVSEEVEMLVRGLLQPTPYRRTQLSKFITNSYFAPEKSTFDAKIKANVCSSDEQRQKFMDFSDETITQFISHVDDASEWEPYAQDKVTGISTMVRKNANSQICVRSQGNILFGGQFQDDMARGLMVSKGNRNVSVMIEQLREHEEIIYYAPAYLIEPLKDYDLPYKFEFLYLQVQRELKDERRFAVIRSIEHPAAPPQTGRVRGHISFAGYVLEKLSEDAHRCTVIHELDLNAELDVNVLELLNHSIMEFILRVRENLRNEKNGMVWKFL